MKRKFMVSFAVLLAAAAFGAVGCNRSTDTTDTQQQTEETHSVYEKDGEKYYDYVSEGEYGYNITVNVNDLKEASRKKITENMLSFNNGSTGYSYDKYTYYKNAYVLAQEIIDYYFTDKVKNITFTLQNATGTLEVSDSEDSMNKGQRYDPKVNLSNDSAVCNNSSNKVLMYIYTTAEKNNSQLMNQAIKDATDNLIIRIAVLKQDESSEIHYIKLERASTGTSAFFYVYDVEME